MKPLTRKHVFECALKGARIDITIHDFGNAALLRQVGILSEVNRDDLSYLHHDIRVVYKGDRRVHSMDAGIPLIGMDKEGKPLITKDL